MDCPECATSSPWWHLFDPTPFMPRSECGDWPGWLMNAWIVPSMMIFTLYMAVAVWEFRQFRRMKGTDFPRWAALSVGLFFLGCAGGHLCNAMAFQWPAYRFFILWDWYTLVASAVGWYGLRAMYKWNEGKYRRATMADGEKAQLTAALRSEKADRMWLSIALTLAETQAELAAQRVKEQEQELARLRVAVGGTT